MYSSRKFFHNECSTKVNNKSSSNYNNNYISFYSRPREQSQGHLQKQHIVDSVEAASIIIIILPRKESALRQTQGQFREWHNLQTAVCNLQNIEKRKGNKVMENNINKQ